MNGATGLLETKAII